MSAGPGRPLLLPALGRPTVVDACSLISLYAAGSVLDDLTHLGAKLYAVPQVRDEALFIRQGQPGAAFKVPLDYQGLAAKGVLREAGPLTHAEEALLVAFVTSGLHDGEAASAAVVVSRRWTPEVLRHWSEVMQISPPDLKRVLQRVEWSASFRVTRDHSLKPWWDAVLGRLP